MRWAEWPNTDLNLMEWTKETQALQQNYFTLPL